MLRFILVFILSLLPFSHSMASGDLNEFISDGNSQGYTAYWNTKNLSDGSWQYVGSWLDAFGGVVQEAFFDSAGRSVRDTPIPYQDFHDWAGGHGFSVGSGNWRTPCGVYQTCDGRFGFLDPR